MGRIKSSIELAMERAAAMDAAGTDPDEFFRQEVDADARALVARFVEDEWFESARLSRFVDRHTGKQKTVVRRVLAGHLVTQVRPDTWTRALEGFETLFPNRAGDELREIARVLKALQAETDAELSRRMDEIRGREEARRRRELDRQGIRGSALVLTPSAQTLRRQALEEVEQELGTRWEAVRSQLSNMVESNE